MRSIKSLRHFAVEMGNPEDRMTLDIENGFPRYDILPLLSLHKKTLQSLALPLCYEQLGRGLAGSILGEFEALEELSIACPPLPTFSAAWGRLPEHYRMPPRLRKLSWTFCGDPGLWQMELISSFMEAAQDTPLTELVVEGSPRYSWLIDHMRKGAVVFRMSPTEEEWIKLLQKWERGGVKATFRPPRTTSSPGLEDGSRRTSNEILRSQTDHS